MDANSGVRLLTTMSSFSPRHAISRAEFFLRLASSCPVSQRDDFEAYLEAAIIFGRTAIHRLKHEFEHHPAWKPWFENLKGNPAIEFFREHRNFTLKEASPKVGQRIGFQQVSNASDLYFFQPYESSITTVSKHLNAITDLIRDASTRFSQPSAT